MKFLLALSKIIDNINLRVGQAVIWLTLVVVLVSASNAIIRKVFNTSSNAWLELQWYLFGAIFLLAAGYTFLRNEHVRVDVLAQKFSKRTQIKIEIFGVLFFLFPACFLIFWLSLPFFYESLVLHELSSNTGGLIRWPAKLLIPVGFGLLILAGLSHLIKCIGFLIGACPDPTARAHGKSAEEELADEILRQAELDARNAAQNTISRGR
ncbi:TRAP transporter small permease subunit [Pollutimonas bauzanensis]|uniref:TRAP transporter small permease protein n=1 Tax=Pollutimonas bauzanensis TaxID=658167 RepID=A0A1M5M4C7_9BURK|nr:TRAP transporter small permease subunit [Pollutimonas bauzanensis]SHG71543.1 TRAP-type mannitol/chloroaromatic compound transport system, small permease component [Pollutimonas bauzanensis]